MAATSQPFAFAGALQLAADQSLPQDPIPFNFSGSFVALASGVVNFPSAGSQDIPFNGVIAPGAKGVLIRYDVQVGAAPVTFTYNSSVTPLELTPGSLMAYFNANPTTGVTSASLTVTAACQVRYWILG